MIGESLGNYRIVDVIGEGGMGVVYRAEHVLIGRRVAIKRLLPTLTRDDELVDRFFNEARAAARIQHPGLCEVFDFGHHTDGSAYIVMELLEGESLAARIEREHPLPPAIALAIARQVASALHAAHEQGIVHRDLKPENLYLIEDRDAPGGVRTKVLDFGIAKLALSEDQRSVKTKTGVVFGTPRYMAPEQCRNATNVDRRADVYALGCIVFEMLVGETPWTYDNWAELVAAHMYEPPPRPSERAARIAPQIDALVLRAMAKLPADRFATMLDFANDLEVSWRATTSGQLAALFTPPAGLPVPSAPRISTGNPLADTSPPELSLTARRSPRRRVLTVAIGCAIALGATVGVYFGLGDRGEPAVTPAPMRAEHTVDASVAPTLPVTAPSDAETTPIAPTTPPVVADAVSRQVQLAVTSLPSGADIYRASDGVRVGRTPFRRAFDRTDGEIEFLIKLAGYRDTRVTLSTSTDGERRVQLQKLRGAVPPTRATTTIDETSKPATSGSGSGTTVLDPYKDP